MRNAECGMRNGGEPPRAIFGEVTLILPSSDEAPLVGVPCAKVGFAEQKSEGETKPPLEQGAPCGYALCWGEPRSGGGLFLTECHRGFSTFSTRATF